MVILLSGILKNKFKGYVCYSALIPLALILSSLAAASPGQEYLSESMECQFIPELISLAQTLDHDPVKIYNWVYENIQLENYDRSRKGAATTFFTKRGNQWDQSSLLITLLRISGIHAQYKYNCCLSNYVWVEAWLPQDNYRGTGGGSNKAWIPLVPWHKEYRIQEGINLFSDQIIPTELDFDFEAYMSSVKQKTALELFEEQVQAFLNRHFSGKSLEDIPYNKTVVKNPSSILPGNLPYGSNLSSDGQVFQEIPNDKRESIVLYFKKSDGTLLLEKTIYLPLISGKRFCLDFIPATLSDEQTIASYGGMCNTPDNAARIVPVLRLNGDIIAQGESLNTGGKFYQAFEGGAYEYTERSLKPAGTLIQMAFDGLSVSEIEIEKAKMELAELSSSLSFSDSTREAYLGRIGNILIKTFLLRGYSAFNRASQILYLTSGNLSMSPTFIYTFPKDLPSSIETKYTVYPQWNIDAHRYTSYIAAADGSSSIDPLGPIGTLFRNLFLHSDSYNEGLIFEDWQGTAGLNTVKGIMVANETGIPVVNLTADDIDGGHLYILENQPVNRIPEDVISYIIDDLEKGQTVTVPAQTISYEGVNGYVYKSIGPEYHSYVFNGDFGGKSGDSQTEASYLDFFNFSEYELIQLEPFFFENDVGELVVDDASSQSNVGSVNSVLSAFGDPVDMVSGEYYHEELPDIDIPSRGFDLTVKRKYKSQLVFDGPFGYGWVWNHGEHLILMDNGDLIFFSNAAKRFYLKNDGDNTYRYPPGTTFKVLVKPDSTYEVKLKSGLKIFFGANGFLKKKEDLNGNYLSFEYNGQNQLTAIKDALNRELSFVYNGDGKIEALTDFEGRTCIYGYDGKDLTSVVDLEGNITRYQYLSEQENPLNNHNMSKCILPNGDYLEIGYYKNDQVAFHRNKKGDVFNFQYSSINRYGETWDESGYYRKVYFNDKNDEIRVDNENGTIEEKTWDASHNLLTRKDGNGNITAYTWDENRNLICKTNSLGEKWIYAYDPVFNKPTEITDPKGNTTRFEYDVKGNLIVKKDALNFENRYHYDAYGNLVKIVDSLLYEEINAFDELGLYRVSHTDKNENITYFAYDTVGRLVSKIGPAGYITNTDYNNYGLPVAITDALGAKIEYEYDENRKITQTTLPNNATIKNAYGIAQDIVAGSKVIEAIDPLGFSEHFKYDNKGNLVKKIDKRGNTYRFFYDGLSRLIEEIDPFQNTVYYDYDGNGNLIGKTDRNGNVYKYTYDASNRKLSATDPLNATTQYEYDANGNLEKEIFPTGSVTLYEYDALNRLVKTTYAYGSPDAVTTEFSYNPVGQLIRKLYADGKYELYSYDGNGNKIRHQFFDYNHILQKDIEFLYNSRNLMTEKIVGNGYNGSGIGHRYDYDGMGRLISETDSAGNQTRYQHDAVGNLVTVIDPQGSITLHEYDLAGQVIKTTDANNIASFFSYDGNGNRVSVRDREGNETYTYYDALNQKIGVVDPLNGTTTLDYDANGNLTGISDPNNGYTQYTYYANNRLNKTIRPLGQETLIEYDAVGNPTAFIDARQNKTTCQYNLLNQLLTKVLYTAADAWETPVRTINFTYDVHGNLTSYDDGTTSAAYMFDSLNRKTTETVDYGPFSKSFAYSYPSNWQKTFTGPDNVTVNFSYDSALRLSAISAPDMPGAGKITYDNYQWYKPGRVTFPGGSRRTYTYDSLMQAETITSQDPAQASIMFRDYWYSAEGNIEEKDTEHGVYIYGYDALHRLTAASNPNAVFGDEIYTYDAMGNRLSNGVVTNWSYNLNNELEYYRAVFLEHDDNGNLTKISQTDRDRVYLYDEADRLVEFKENGAAIATYYYDPFGRRLWKEVDSVRTYFLYSDEGLIGECDATGIELRSYGYRPGSHWTTDPIYQKIGGTYYWYQNDHLGTPQQLTTSDGTVVWEATYDSFGNVQIATESVTSNLRFPGHYYDNETGLHYNWHRYYDPGTGRYIRTDPAIEGLNLYVYVNNNPLIMTDPRGLRAKKALSSWYETNFTSQGFGPSGQPYAPLMNYLTSDQPMLNRALQNSVAAPLYNLTAETWNAFWRVQSGYFSEADLLSTAALLAPGSQAFAPAIEYGSIKIISYLGKAGPYVDDFIYGIDDGISMLKNETGSIGYDFAATEQSDIVYRRLNLAERYTASAKGLSPRSLGSNITPEQHVLGARNTPYISTTRDYNVALSYNRNATPIVEIDLSKVPGKVIDLTKSTNLSKLTNRKAIYNATRDAEILIQGNIPAEAIGKVHFP